MSDMCDEMAFLASLVGNKPMAPPKPMSAGVMANAIVPFFSFSGTRTVGSARMADVMVMGLPQPCNTVLVDAQLRLPVMKEDPVARAAKDARDAADGKRSRTAVPRLMMGHANLEPGQVVSLMVFETSQTVPAGRASSMGARYWEEEVFKGRRLLRLRQTKADPGKPLRALDADEMEVLLASAVHGCQLLPHLVMPVYSGTLQDTEALRKLKAAEMADLLTPATRHMRGNDPIMLPLLRWDPRLLVARRTARGLPGVNMSLPGLSLQSEYGQWPFVGKKQDGSVDRKLRVNFKLALEQILLGQPPQEVTASVTVWETTLMRAFGVDDRHWPQALPFLVHKTPGVVKVYCSSLPQHDSVYTPVEGSPFLLEFSSSKENDDPNACNMLVSLPHGIVNAGYPVSKAFVLDMLRTLATQDKHRYNPNMALAPPRRLRTYPMVAGQEVTLSDHPTHYAHEKPPVVNIRECHDDVAGLSEAEWRFFAIPNVAEKDANIDNTVVTPGMALLRQIYADHGEAMAQEVVGAALLSAMARGFVFISDKGFPEDVAKAAETIFQRSAPYDVLVFAVRADIYAGLKLDPLCSHNENAMLERIFTQWYPNITNQAAEAMRAKAAAELPADAGGVNDDDLLTLGENAAPDEPRRKRPVDEDADVPSPKARAASPDGDDE